MNELLLQSSLVGSSNGDNTLHRSRRYSETFPPSVRSIMPRSTSQEVVASVSALIHLLQGFGICHITTLVTLPIHQEDSGICTVCKNHCEFVGKVSHLTGQFMCSWHSENIEATMVRILDNDEMIEVCANVARVLDR